MSQVGAPLKKWVYLPSSFCTTRRPDLAFLVVRFGGLLPWGYGGSIFPNKTLNTKTGPWAARININH
jgi:hypothetical protein